MDASLRELSETIQREVEQARKKENELHFSLIYSDAQGKMKRKDIGIVRIGSKG